MVNVGRKIRQARMHKRMTQNDLAKAIGISDKSISAYESERITPPIDILEKIAQHTGLTMTYFLEESPESVILSKLKDVEREFQEIKELLKQRNA